MMDNSPNNYSDAVNKKASSIGFGLNGIDKVSFYTKEDVDEKLNNYLKAQANLLDVGDVDEARSNLGVYSYSEVADLLRQSEDGVLSEINSVSQDVQNNSANIFSFAVAKANRGEFWFQGGTLQNDTLKYSQGNPFSFAFGFRANKSDILGITTSIYILNLGFLYLYLPADSKKIAFYSSNPALVKYISEVDNDRLLNGEWHSLIVSYDGTTLKLSDETGVLVSVSATLQSQASSSPIKLGAGFVGQMSRIKYFNFDMSSDDAPYTIADYIAGKDESPLLKNGRARVLDNTHPSWEIYNSSSFDLLKDSTADTLTATCIASNNYLAISDGYSYVAKAGDVISISWDSIEIPTGISVNSVQFKANGITVATSNNESHIIPKDSAYIILQFNFSNNVSVGDVITITGLKIKVNGALLSLEDIKSGVQVLDKSGNGNHANISGLVCATKENNPARCVDSASFSWAGTATTQKFANSDVAIPVNSKVVAYAKASVGMSASFTCGSNSAVSKELSANTLTEIGSFFNASQGAFKVAPSSAITGKMDVYLTIEKF
jgi:hypothetical protein